MTIVCTTVPGKQVQKTSGSSPVDLFHGSPGLACLMMGLAQVKHDVMISSESCLLTRVRRPVVNRIGHELDSINAVQEEINHLASELKKKNEELQSRTLIQSRLERLQDHYSKPPDPMPKPRLKSQPVTNKVKHLIQENVLQKGATYKQVAQTFDISERTV